VDRVPDDLRLPPEQCLAEAQRLLDRGMPFHAHELFEGTWKAAPPAERALWQGLAQLAVGLTHLLRGNARGAGTVLRRGRDRVARYADDPPYDLDVPGLVAWADRLLAGLAGAGGAAPGGPAPGGAAPGGPAPGGPLEALAREAGVPRLCPARLR